MIQLVYYHLAVTLGKSTFFGSRHSDQVNTNFFTTKLTKKLYNYSGFTVGCLDLFIASCSFVYFVVYYSLLQRIIEGKTTRSPITAVIIIIALSMPKLIVGTNQLNTINPKPMHSISDDERIALPFIGSVMKIYSCGSGFPAAIKKRKSKKRPATSKKRPALR